MKMPKLVVGYLLDDEVFVKSFTIPESHDWIKWLANEELAQFFGELFALMIQISEEKEDSETLRTFLEYWYEIAEEWREIALGEEDPEIFEEDSETPPTVVTDWSVDALEAALKGQDPATLFNSLAGLLGKAMVSSERDALADILESEQDLESDWIDIIEVQREPKSTTHKTHTEPEPVVDITEDQRDTYLALSISDLELSTRAYNCLKKENIKTVRDLVTKRNGNWWNTRGWDQRRSTKSETDSLPGGFTSAWTWMTRTTRRHPSKCLDIGRYQKLWKSPILNNALHKAKTPQLNSKRTSIRRLSKPLLRLPIPTEVSFLSVSLITERSEELPLGKRHSETGQTGLPKRLNRGWFWKLNRLT